MDLIRSNTSRYILCNLVICRFRYDNICKNVNIKCPIRSRSDPNIATCFLDLGHLCTCRYLCLRRDAFITNRYAQLRWGKIMTAAPMLILELLEVGRGRWSRLKPQLDPDNISSIFLTAMTNRNWKQCSVLIVSSRIDQDHHD